jgi:hypothetical protein
MARISHVWTAPTRRTRAELVIHASRELVPTPPPINIVPVHFPDRDLAAARVLKKDVGEAVVIEIAFQFGAAIDRDGLRRSLYHNLRVVRVRV